MDTMRAFARGQAAGDAEHRVFDWNKAAQLINEYQPKEASAGLSEDWEWTGGIIFAGGKPVKDGYTYLASNWATPEIELDGELHSCFVMQSEQPDWNSATKWPDSALQILEGKNG